MREREFIAALQRAFPRAGLGDDAASLGPPARRPDGSVLLSTDAVVERVHFDRRYGTLSQAVQKLVTSNVSDIHAMGGRPDAILFTAGLPRGCAGGDVEEIIDGLQKGTSFYGVSPVGGDTVESGQAFFFNISIVGVPDAVMPVTRGGAGIGDLLVLFGECGGSLLGLTLLQHLCGMRTMERMPEPFAAELPPWGELSAIISALAIDSDAAAIGRVAGNRSGAAGDMIALAGRHLVPRSCPVPRELLTMDPPIITAMIDVSDGLARDVRNLCEASRVGAVLREETLPVSEAFQHVLARDAEFASELILASGEEYVMLAACREQPSQGTVIGEIVAEDEGIAIIGRDGMKRELPDTGYEHTF